MTLHLGVRLGVARLGGGALALEQLQELRLEADRLQTGMRGAYGKPQGLVARARIGQPLMSVRVKDHHEAHAYEALRRAKFKFPGRQKIFTSKKWGFTKFDREEFQEGLQNGKIVTDGVGCQYKPNHGPIAAWKKRMA